MKNHYEKPSPRFTPVSGFQTLDQDYFRPPSYCLDNSDPNQKLTLEGTALSSFFTKENYE